MVAVLLPDFSAAFRDIGQTRTLIAYLPMCYVKCITSLVPNNKKSNEGKSRTSPVISHTTTLHGKDFIITFILSSFIYFSYICLPRPHHFSGKTALNTSEVLRNKSTHTQTNVEEVI